ncbi:hypothetical protein BBH88_11670 [Planococcus antarcticus DSM 14505]|uniref:Uncharacterized protein n=1 Tax=Planococcus antarcticus DSM 14505 TaxID=1185653 RepID=A0ABN4RFW1_9BACL|nr:hypothetical protein BBH88_11670 [Planococcus antarcticus DSM 14505]
MKNQHADARKVLYKALNGISPFGKFKTAIKNMNLDRKWHDFEQECAEREVKEWLDSRQIDWTGFTK